MSSMYLQKLLGGYWEIIVIAHQYPEKVDPDQVHKVGAEEV